MINDSIEVTEVAPGYRGADETPVAADDDTGDRRGRGCAQRGRCRSKSVAPRPGAHMYMREIVLLELLTREGEIAIAKAQ